MSISSKMPQSWHRKLPVFSNLSRIQVFGFEVSTKKLTALDFTGTAAHAGGSADREGTGAELGSDANGHRWQCPD